MRPGPDALRCGLCGYILVTVSDIDVTAHDTEAVVKTLCGR